MTTLTAGSVTGVSSSHAASGGTLPGIPQDTAEVKIARRIQQFSHDRRSAVFSPGSADAATFRC
jgi:hypothetical protein